MALTCRTTRHYLKKRHLLTISRGTSEGTLGLFIEISDGTVTGLGEVAGASCRSEAGLSAAEAGIRALVENGAADAGPVACWDEARRTGLAPDAVAGLDIALWDLLAKRCACPLYRLLGLPRPTVATSVTIGIAPVDVIHERVPAMLAETGARHLKIKLGSPEGPERDRAMFEASRETAGNAQLRVDANGGWSLADALHMCRWLAERGVDYVEQPLPKGAEDQLPALFHDRPLPIFVDESCHLATDVPGLAGSVDGVNLKLMKCGGLTEALRLVHTARAHGLLTMAGCFGESHVAISAAAAIGALFDHLDLDSHLNLTTDPTVGAALVDGIVQPPERPGHGARWYDADA